MGKTVLVTGASSGIGYATAQLFLQNGFTVYAAARRLHKMQDLAEAGAYTREMDITVEEHVTRLIDEINDEQGGVDILVNNAGFASYGAVEETPIDEARYQFEVNLFGLARITQLALPAMREKGAGTIINISSVGGKIYTPLGAWYHATKHALEGWSDCLRFELEPFGIDVVIIEPGIIGTEFGDAMTGPMVEGANDSPYREMAESMKASSDESYDNPKNSTPPSVVAATILKAATARRPKPRYAIGKMAKPMIFMRWLLSDRLFDKALSTQLS
jgi:short-subunit dehydrogenase